MAETMWLSKYALSGGIKEVVGERSSVGGYFRPVGLYGIYKIGVHIHRTEQEAKDTAEGMRIKKIDSLKKQIAKLEKLKF